MSTIVSANMIDKLANVHVTVVGDVMIDKYVYGSTHRISPEAPVPILSVREERAMLGGAGNVVRALSELGARVRFIAVVGDDARARQVEDLCKDLPGTDPIMVSAKNRQTSLKTRFVAAGQQLLRADEEETSDLTEEVLTELRTAALDDLANTDVLVLSDYGKGVLTPEILRTLIDRARARSIQVLVDPKGNDYSRYRGANLVTPNQAELAQATGLPVGDDASTETAARTLAKQAEVDAVLATRGADGMLLLMPDGTQDQVAAEAREVFDVSGAGDTVIATMAAAVGAGLSLPIAMRLANAAAGVVVGKTGTAVARPTEIAAAIEKSGGKKALTEPQAACEQRARWQAAGLSVGFANGCFDLLHPGHLHLLRQAREACDRLIVGLNSDASVQRLKGPDRPVRNQQERAEIIAALEMVDLVTMFDADTPLDLIKALRPDILVKGADYARADVVGGDFVEANGGRVLLAELLPGASTSATIDKMRTTQD